MLKYKIIPIWDIEVKEGKTIMPEDQFSRYQKWLLSHNGKYQFIIKKIFKKRSNPQNNFYWGVVIPMISEEIGEENENETHALLKAKFLSKEKVVAGINGQWEKQKIVGRTSKLDTNGFAEYIMKIQIWASKFLGIVIPDPDPNYNTQPILIEDD